MFNFYFFSLIGCHEVLFFFRQDIAFASALDELYNNDFLYGFDFKRQTKFYMAKFFNIGYKNIWKLMYRSRNERLKFSGVEDETLLSIICQFQESKDSLCFKKIMNMFNSQMKKKVKSHPKRKVQVLRDRYYLLERGQRSEWKYEHEKLMLQLVSKGNSWSQIAKIPAFELNNFNNNYIKKQFETCQRIKVRALTSYFLKSFSKHISDRTLQIIICKHKLLNLLDQSIITAQDYQLFMKNQSFLMLCRMNQNNVKICMRRKETKERVFEKFGILKDDNGKKLAQAIIKIDNFIKSGFEDFYLQTVIKKQEYVKVEEDKETEMNTVINADSLAFEYEELIHFEEIQSYSNQFQSNLQFSVIHLDSEDQQLDKHLRTIFQGQ